MNKTSSKISIKNKEDIEIPITNNANMNIFFNRKTKLLYFQDNYGNEYDLNGFSRGFMGADGEKGDQGEKGERGEKGPQGPRGDRGYNGKNGEKGEKGEQGEKGLTGQKGDRGLRGPTGEQGPIGLKGEQGIRGPKGDRGDRGDAGPKGDRGEQGLRGLKGDKGERGDCGPKGEPGVCNCTYNNMQPTTEIIRNIEEKNNKLFLTEGREVLINKSDLNFEIPCSADKIISINFDKNLNNNTDIFDIDECCNTKISFKEKGIYKITYNICWYVDINNIVKQEYDSGKQNELVKEAKKTIKGGIVCFLHEDDEMIHQSTIHNQGSVFVNTARHTFIINKKSSRSYNNLSIGIHKGYEGKEEIDISIHQEGTYLEIEALN